MKKLKQIAALIVITIWGILLITTLIVSFGNNSQLFNGLIITDIALPIVAYAIMLMYRILSGRNKPDAKNPENEKEK